MAKVEIYDLMNNKPGELIATIAQNGKVTPADDSTLFIQEHVDRIKRRIRGKELLEHMERSYTNGLMMARTVR